MHLLKKITVLLGWFGLYKVAWACAIMGGGVYGYPILASIPMLIWSALWIFFQPNRKANTLMAIIAGLFGLIWDSGLVYLGIMEFPPSARAITLSPPWMVSLWISFGAITHISFQKIYGKYLWAILIGGLGGPMAYWGGVAMDALIVSSSKGLFLSSIALEWVIAFPFLIWAGEQTHQKSTTKADSLGNQRLEDSSAKK